MVESRETVLKEERQTLPLFLLIISDLYSP